MFKHPNDNKTNINIQMTKQSTFKHPNDKQPTFKLFEYLYI